MARGTNLVILRGNLTADPEVRYTGSGTAVTTVGIAVNESFKNKDGEWEERPQFLDVVVWGRQAETLGEYQQKGSHVEVIGSLKKRSYENKDGVKVYVTEVNANEVHFLDKRGAQVDGDDSEGPDDDLPF